MYLVFLLRTHTVTEVAILWVVLYHHSNLDYYYELRVHIRFRQLPQHPRFQHSGRWHYVR